MTIFKPVYGLVLGGGGARGGAHVGVLRVLDEVGYQPDVIVGTSIGGLLTIALGAGWSVDQIEDLFRQVDFHQITELDRTGGGLIGNRLLRELLEDNFGGLDLRDLSPKVAVMSADVRNGQRVLIQEGSVVQAGLATSAVPGLFPPIEWEGRLLVDGGIIDNVPTQAAYELGAQRLVAVDIEGFVDLDVALGDVGTVSKRFQRVLHWLLDLSNRQRTFDVSIRSAMLTQHMLTQYELSLFPPDVLIHPEIPDIGLMAFDRWEETVKLGEVAARAVQERIGEIMRRPNLFARHDPKALPPIVSMDGQHMRREIRRLVED